jgi:hypothetical protein
MRRRREGIGFVVFLMLTPALTSIMSRAISAAAHAPCAGVMASGTPPAHMKASPMVSNWTPPHPVKFASLASAYPAHPQAPRSRRLECVDRPAEAEVAELETLSVSSTWTPLDFVGSSPNRPSLATP